MNTMTSLSYASTTIAFSVIILLSSSLSLSSTKTSLSWSSIYCHGFHLHPTNSFQKTYKNLHMNKHSYIHGKNAISLDTRQLLSNRFFSTSIDTSPTVLYYYKNKKYKQDKDDGNPYWYPPKQKEPGSMDVNFNGYEGRIALQNRCIEFLTHQILSTLHKISPSNDNNPAGSKLPSQTNTFEEKVETEAETIIEDNILIHKKATKLAKGRFLYLTHDLKGEQILEQIISQNIPSSFLTTNIKNEANDVISESSTTDDFEDVVKGAIMALQSLLILGMQYGVKGSTFMQNKRLAHLKPDDENTNTQTLDTNTDTISVWTYEDVKRLKHERNTKAAIQLLASLKRKQSAQGAFDILVQLGVWSKHENLDILRSGFPTRFTDEEEVAAKEASTSNHDPDQILNIRKDLRRLKVYTIDSASTSEIDDGISIEVLTDSNPNPDSSIGIDSVTDDDTYQPGIDESLNETKSNTNIIRQRYWIHIADADRWAPRGSSILKCAQRRATSIYLPTNSYPMFPTQMSVKSMSLNANHNSCALSLGVELNPDGSINENTIVVTPSLIEVSYRLTYDEVDEMLEEGVGYNEEWQLGALLTAATKRRKFRCDNGSSEGTVQALIPQGIVNVQPTINNGVRDSDINDEESEKNEDQQLFLEDDSVDISVYVETTHNAGVNASSTVADSTSPSATYSAPVSPANLLVTEMMILGGEAMGKWGQICTEKEKIRINVESGSDANIPFLENKISLPYRCQPKPDLKSREREANFLQYLQEENVGYGYCAAWYFRRFLNPATVSEKPKIHSGMGLDCYVQWSSPIRRYGDLQVHAAVKRYLRRERINKLIESNKSIPPGITSMDLGCELPASPSATTKQEDVLPINYNDGMALFRAGRPLQRNAQQYWTFEYIRRLVVQNPKEEVAFKCLILGVVDAERNLYAIYMHEIGLEHKYLSEIGELDPGRSLWLKVKSVNPRIGLLHLSLASENASAQKRVIVAKAA